MKLLFLSFLLPALSQAAPGDLCRAVMDQNPSLEQVKSAVAAGESVNTTCGSFSAVAWAMLHSGMRADIPVWLVQQGADPNFVNSERAGSWGHGRKYTTNLARAASMSTPEVLRAFLARSPEVDFAPYGKTALAHALEASRWDNADLLLAAGADRYVVAYTVDGSGVKTIRSTALSIVLASIDTVPWARKLYDSWDFSRDHIDLNAAYLLPSLRETKPSLARIQRFIGLGANPREIVPSPGAPAENAISAFVVVADWQEFPEARSVLQYLFSLGLDVNDGAGGPLLEAVWRGVDWIVQALLEHGANPNLAVGDQTPLRLAADLGHVAELQLLVRHGANLEARDYLGRTALLIAAWNDSADAVAELVRAGAHVNARGNDGRSALCLAKLNGNRGIQELLRSHGASLGQCRPF